MTNQESVAVFVVRKAIEDRGLPMVSDEMLLVCARLLIEKGLVKLVDSVQAK